MPTQVRVWKVGENDKLDEISSAKLDLEARLESWTHSDITILSDELLVIGRQVETDYGGFIDMLCIDQNGDLVIVELKRDKTPREVTAQALDYASWITDLSREDIFSIAGKHEGEGSNLEGIYQAKFGHELPEVINESHSMIVVASSIDSSTERIIRYLSDGYGVKINSAMFQFFKDQDSSQEYLARFFLIEPSDVEQRAQRRGGSKRKPNLTFEELEEIADGRGVLELYQHAVKTLEGSFYKQSTRSSLAFSGPFESGRKVLFSLIPTESSKSTGLRYQIYSWRAAEFTGKDFEEVIKNLSDNREEWKYTSNANKEWSGHAGYLTEKKDTEKFASIFLPITRD